MPPIKMPSPDVPNDSELPEARRHKPSAGGAATSENSSGAHAMETEAEAASNGAHAKKMRDEDTENNNYKQQLAPKDDSLVMIHHNGESRIIMDDENDTKDAEKTVKKQKTPSQPTNTIPPRNCDWLPKNKSHITAWIRDLKSRAHLTSHIIPIVEFKELVEHDPVLSRLAQDMFSEAKRHKHLTPLDTPEVENFNEFLVLLNHIMTQAPEFTEYFDPKNDALESYGLIGFPINALLDWPMDTDSGHAFFANELVNQQFKKILTHWSLYLSFTDSRSVLIDNYPERVPKVFGWLSDNARKEMVKVACQAEPSDSADHQQPFEHFFNCDPSDKYYGFKSWDDFFTRTFVDGVRPVAEGDDVIANACESAPLQVVTNVAKSSSFWLKGQPYSLENMMDFDPLAEQFVDGTIYQAFLSALSYHRWNSPVSGIIKKTYMVNGSYYLGNRYQGFINPQGADETAPNNSQPFLTAVATRAVIFIESDNPKIGLMCFIAVGMAEVSSCNITVEEGQHVNKGDGLGMFHFGGSTHCLIFRPDVKLKFDFHNNKKPGLDATNIPVCSRIATVINCSDQ